MTKFHFFLAANILIKPMLLAPKLTIAEALRSIEHLGKCNVPRHKKVIISIGASDLRNGIKLFDMRKQFVTLFTTCLRNGYKPLITTIASFDSPELNRKADIFNSFLMQNFSNVFDVFTAVRSGFGLSLSTMTKP